IVQTIGIIGDAKACQSLIKFLEQTVAEPMSPAHYRSKTEVLFALAFVVERDKNATKALDYLIASLDPIVWDQRLHWSDPYHPGNLRNEHLIKIAILALGLAHHPRA